MAIAEPVAAAAVEDSAAAGSAPLRVPRKGGSTMAVDGENRPPKPKPKPRPKPAAKPAEEPAPAQEPAPAEEPDDDEEPRRGRRAFPNPGGAVREGSWVVLGFLGWVWVALPFIKGGPAGVGQVLAAKFVNRTPGGES